MDPHAARELLEYLRTCYPIFLLSLFAVLGLAASGTAIDGQISAELRDALVPRCSAGRRDGARPVSTGPLGRNMVGVAAELETSVA